MPAASNAECNEAQDARPTGHSMKQIQRQLGFVHTPGIPPGTSPGSALASTSKLVSHTRAPRQSESLLQLSAQMASDL